MTTDVIFCVCLNAPGCLQSLFSSKFWWINIAHWCFFCYNLVQWLCQYHWPISLVNMTCQYHSSLPPTLSPPPVHIKITLFLDHRMTTIFRCPIMHPFPPKEGVAPMRRWCGSCGVVHTPPPAVEIPPTPSLIDSNSTKPHEMAYYTAYFLLYLFQWT